MKINEQYVWHAVWLITVLTAIALAFIIRSELVSDAAIAKCRDAGKVAVVGYFESNKPVMVCFPLPKTDDGR